MSKKKDNPFEDPVDIEVEGSEPAANTSDDTETMAEQPVEAALQKAEEELAKHREAMLRMQAEMDNLRKRLIRDLEKSKKLALERIMKDLLQVWDSLERGLQAENGALTVESLKEGQELTLRVLEKVMKAHDLEILDPVNELFNPEFHQAMTVIPVEGIEENTVVEVLQKGFLLHDRLIRPAMVVVSGKP